MVYLTGGNKVFIKLGMGQSAPSVYADDTKPGGGADRPEDWWLNKLEKQTNRILRRPAAGNANFVAVTEQPHAPGEDVGHSAGN